MDSIRKKYKLVFERVIDAITEEHPELDAHRVIATQSWTDGEIGFGRKSWGIDKYGNPNGLWMGNLKLELLTADDSEGPYSCIWITNKNSNLDIDAARLAMNDAAKKLLNPKERQGVEIAEADDDVLLWLPAPSKRQLLDALVDGDGQGFVKVFVGQFEMMARFVPGLDKVLRDSVRKKQ
jgi:hypothetical protein